MDVMTGAYGRESGIYGSEICPALSVDLYSSWSKLAPHVHTPLTHTRARASPPFPVDVNKLCSPTRTALLSGRYAYTNGMDDGVIIDGQGTVSCHEHLYCEMCVASVTRNLSDPHHGWSRTRDALSHARRSWLVPRAASHAWVPGALLMLGSTAGTASRAWVQNVFTHSSLHSFP